jgi:sugar/nucleoside kinase (ribokinase family)
MMAKALVIGEVCIDVLVKNPESVAVKGVPVWAEDIVLRLGGSATYVSQGLTSLGIDVSMRGVAGSDSFTSDSLLKLTQTGIDIQSLKILPDQSSSTCVGIIGTGIKKKFVGCSPFKPFTSDMFEDNAEGIDLVYFGGYLIYPELWDGILEDYFRRIHSHAITVLDTQMLPIPPEHYAEEALRPALLSEVDVLLVDRREALVLTESINPEIAAQKLLDLGPKLVIVKLGEDGCLLANGQEMQYFSTKSIISVEPIGAGDFFGSAISYGLIQKWKIEKTCKFANAFAALCVSRTSDQLPGLEQTQESANNI